MATMARSLGIPARIAVGFTAGEVTETVEGETDEDPTLRTGTVTTDNLHAWPELYFAGIGWVQFEPTPGRGSPENTTDGLPQEDALEEAEPLPEATPTAAPTPTVEPSTVPSLEPNEPVDPSPGESATGVDRGILIPILAAIVALALLAAPGLVRLARTTRRRRRVSTTGSPRDAWAEITDVATDLGLGADTTRTPRETAHALALYISDDAAALAALWRARAALERSAFARDAPSTVWRDVRDVTSSLREHTPVRASVLARILPTSVWRR